MAGNRSVPNKKNAIITEGKALLSAIIDAEEIYYSQNDNNEYFLTNGYVTSISATVTGSSGIDASTNKYFRRFDISGDEGSSINIESIYEKGENRIVINVVLSPNSKPVYNEEIS